MGTLPESAVPRGLDEVSLRVAVDVLCADDPGLRAVVERHGRPPLWEREPGFATLVLLILEQQVSLASARAAYDRLATRVGSVGPVAILDSSDDELRADGFSHQKTRYARALATAVHDGSLDLDDVETLDDNGVRAALTALPGIGAWTADVYLVMALRRPDAWPTGDIALQEAIRRVERLDARPVPAAADAIADRWRPHRAAAARILWHLYLSEPIRRPSRAGLQ